VLGLLAVLFLVVPVLELAVIVQVAGAIGVGQTIGLLILVSVVGAWLCKHEGLGVVRRIQTALQRGELPHREVVDGALVLLAGALLLTPGFLSDVMGIVLLVPPTRAVVRALVWRRLRDRVVVTAGTGTAPGGAAGRVIDTTGR
jgi:UPF0716 protein FxsA